MFVAGALLRLTDHLFGGTKEAPPSGGTDPPAPSTATSIPLVQVDRVDSGCNAAHAEEKGDDDCLGREPDERQPPSKVGSALANTELTSVGAVHSPAVRGSKRDVDTEVEQDFPLRRTDSGLVSCNGQGSSTLIERRVGGDGGTREHDTNSGGAVHVGTTVVLPHVAALCEASAVS